MSRYCLLVAVALTQANGNAERPHVLFRDWESKCANFPVGLTEQSESLHWYCILPLCVLLLLGCLITRAVWRRHQRVLQDRANLRISRDRAHVDLQIHLHQKANGASA